ncbi:hypothetical protein [Thermomonas sp.]|uniref:hypothetical protein n=1 Tax=Thermomonas sp. TaxID=1971895 RepID=UPI0024871770|nr:hypothetical protein [Thermomonas sp.]MDI1252821.1 hypothetical protein [Thermomonas sp.]
MSPNDVIESYVVDVMRRVSARDRNEVGLELRGLLTEMLDDRAQAAGRPADDALVLAVLREFGTPAEIAARYRPPGMLVIPAEQTRSFAMLSIIGITLQWALTLPQVFDGSLAISGWWLTWGLGAFWWPGFQAMMALLVAWLRSRGLFLPKWTPRIADPDRVDRGGMIAGLVGFAIAMSFMIALPWLVGLMPEPLSGVFAFDPEFLRARAWPVLVLWIGSFAIMVTVVKHGRQSMLTRRLELGTSLGFVTLLAWWLSAGNIFIEKSTNDGARGGLALVIAFIVIDIAIKLYRGRPRITAPHVSGR